MRRGRTCACPTPQWLALCSTCLDDAVDGAGTQLCPFHLTSGGKHPRKSKCRDCAALLDIDRPVRWKPDALPSDVTMLLCSEMFALANLTGKGWEFKKMADSVRKRYADITGRVLQGVTRGPDNIQSRFVKRAPEGAKPSFARVCPTGTCEKCKNTFKRSWKTAGAQPQARPGLCTNKVVGSFEFGEFVDIEIRRSRRHDAPPTSQCPCAFEYDTTPISRLLAHWNPPDGRKARCIEFLSHFAWVDTRGSTPKESPGWLRAHKILKPRRYLRPQTWGAASGQSSCVLRRHAVRCECIRSLRGPKP